MIQCVETLDHQVETMGKTVETLGKKIHRDQTLIEKLSHEIAQLKRLKFAKRSEQMNPEQASLLDDLIDTDIAAVEAELQALQTGPAATEKKQKPKRTALPTEFPRTLIHHEPVNTHCPCGCALKRIGEDVSEKLDYTPGVITVERHVRGKCVCDDCETLIQAPVPAQVIDKGISTAGLLAHVMIAKFADHLVLLKQMLHTSAHTLDKVLIFDQRLIFRLVYCLRLYAEERAWRQLPQEAPDRKQRL